MSARIAIGFGATSSARVDDIVALVRTALSTLDATESQDRSPSTVVIATLDRRIALAHDVARALVRDVAIEFACEIVTFDAPTLGSVEGPLASSQRALASVGTASVAEAAALAALRPARARLVVTRTTGRHCTCAIAEAM